MVGTVALHELQLFCPATHAVLGATVVHTGRVVGPLAGTGVVVLPSVVDRGWQ